MKYLHSEKILMGVMLFLTIGIGAQAQNVGIGNAAPQEKLDVSGAIKVGTDTNDSTTAPIGGAGTIRFRGGIFEGWDGSLWTPFTSNNKMFVLDNNLVRPDTSLIDLATNDFIFGAYFLEEQNDPALDSRFFFDKSKGAFRAGTVTGDQWNDAKRGEQSFAVGYDVTASGDFSITLGERSRATGIGAVALGRKAYAYGDHSFAWGNHSQATGYGAVSFGNRSYATADFSYASGSNVYAQGEYSVALGSYATADGNASFAIGSQVNATGNGTMAVGYNATATHTGSVAIGAEVTSSNEGAFVIGTSSYASGFYSIAAGHNNTVSGRESMTLGYNNTISGWEALGIGYDLLASGSYSVVFGHNNQALSAYEHVLGRYNTVYTPADTLNWIATDRLFTVGNGTSSTNRSDALTILKNGNVGIGTSTPNALLHLDGTLRYVDGNQQVGHVLTSDGAGNASWQALAPDNDDQSLTGATLIGTSLQIDIEDGSSATVDLTSLVDDADADASNELQSLSRTGTDVTLSNGGGIISVADNDNDAGNEIQSLSLSGNTLSISGSNNVDLSGYVSTDDQNLTGASLTGNTLQIDIEGGSSTSVDLSALVNDADADASNEIQSLSRTGTDVTLSNGGGIISVADNDNDASNEIQSLNLTGNTLSISGSNNVDLSGYVSTDDQNLTGASLSGTTLQIDIEGGSSASVDLSALVNDADADASNEIQSLSRTGTDVTLSNGGGIISVADNDNDASNELQTLSVSGNEVTLSNGGGTVAVDDGDWTVNGSDIYNANAGNVGVGVVTPGARFEVSGAESTTHGVNAGFRISNTAIGGDFWVMRVGANGTQTPAGGFSIASPSGYHMTIDPSGSVGFGTTGPDAFLHLSNNTRGETHGIKLTQTNYNSLIYHNEDGDLILRKASETDQLVLDSDGNVGVGTSIPGDKLHVSGSIRMVDGNQANGYVATSDANGTMSWKDPKRAVGYVKQSGTLSESGSSWRDLVSNSSQTIDVTSGDVISVWADANIRFTSGSGNDDFEYRVSYSGCASGNMQTKGMRFDEDSGHDNWTPLSYADAMVAPCTGTLTLKYSVRRSSGDDAWEARNGVVIFRRN